MEPFVKVDRYGPGLRDSEASVGVRDVNGRTANLRCERDYLRIEGESQYLPIGIVGQHPQTKLVLIELPWEADNGANRLWVRPDQLLKEVAVA